MTAAESWLIAGADDLIKLDCGHTARRHLEPATCEMCVNDMRASVAAVEAFLEARAALAGAGNTIATVVTSTPNAPHRILRHSDLATIMAGVERGLA